MPSWLTRLTGGQCDAYIKISPQSDFVILSGSAREAPGQYIRGKVTLCLPSAQRARGVQLQLVGYHRTSYVASNPLSFLFVLLCVGR